MKSLRQLIIASMLLSIPIGVTHAGDPEIASGGWVEKGYAINGGWSIVERDNKRFIVFDDKFKTRKGPDLKVYLSRLPIDTIRDSEVDESSLKISPLKSNKGKQEYEIPGDVNLDEYASLLVHCEAYSHLWGGGSLE